MKKHLFQVDYRHLDSGEMETKFVFTPSAQAHKYRMLLRRKGYTRVKMTHMGTVSCDAKEPNSREEAERLLQEV